MNLQPSFLQVIRQHRQALPYVSALLSSIRTADRQRTHSDKSSDLFRYRNPAYWDRCFRTQSLAYDELRQWFNAQSMVDLTSEHATWRRRARELAAGEMNLGRGYMRYAARRRIDRLEEFILMKSLMTEWPSLEDLLVEDHDTA